MSHIEERQHLKDEAFVRAEQDIVYWQEYFDELEAAKKEHQKPARIEIVKVLEDDRIEIDSLPF